MLPHATDASFDEDATKIGYEISFNRYFYKPQPLRSLDESTRHFGGRTTNGRLAERNRRKLDMIDGLKPYSTYKDSDVPWLGDVSEHWEVGRLKRYAANVIEQTGEREAGDIYVALEHVESWTGYLRDDELGVTFDSQVKRFRAGDVMFGKLRPYLAKVTRPCKHGVCVSEFFVLRPRDPSLLGAYLERLLRSKPVIAAVDSSTFGAKMPRADWQSVGDMKIAIPPPLDQAAIVRFLDHADTRIRRRGGRLPASFPPEA